MSVQDFLRLLKNRWALALVVFVAVCLLAGALLVPHARLAGARTTVTCAANYAGLSAIVDEQAAALRENPGIDSVALFQNQRTASITATVLSTDSQTAQESADALAKQAVDAANAAYGAEGAPVASATAAQLAPVSKKAVILAAGAAGAIGLFTAACAVLLASALARRREDGKATVPDSPPQLVSAPDGSGVKAPAPDKPLSGEPRMGRVPLVLYYVAFGIYLCSYLCEFTTLAGRFAWLPQVYVAMRWASLVLLAPKFITQRFAAHEVVIAWALVMVGATCYAVSRDINFLVMFCFIVAGQKVDVKVLAQIVLIEEAVLFVMLAAMSQTGYIEGLQEVRDGKTRLALGYSHPNRLGAAMTAMCCAYAVMHFPKIRAHHFAFFAVAGVLTWVVADSRTSVAVIVFIAVLYAVCSLAHGRRGQRAVIVCLGLVVFAVMAFSLYLMVFFDPQVAWQVRLNGLLSSRLSLIQEYFRQYPHTLFGFDTFQTPVALYAGGGIVIDNTYARAFLTCGIVPACVFFALYLALFVWAMKQNRLEAFLLGAVVYALVGFTEWQGMHFALNYCMVGCASFLYARSLKQGELPDAGEPADGDGAAGASEAS